MGNVLAALGVVLAAFAVWLTVRIVNRHERWAIRMAMGLVVVLVLYPLSFGPIHWFVNSRPLEKRTLNSVATFYWPLRWMAENADVLDNSIRSDADLWSPETPHRHDGNIKRFRSPTKKDTVLFW